MVQWCRINFLCQGVLLIRISVGQGPTALAVGADGVFLDLFLAHLSRWLRGSLCIGRLRCPPSVVRPSTISNDFSSETTGPIATKFHIQPSGPLGKKNYSNCLGHMTNMSAMPLYGKNLKKSSSPEPVGQ